MARKVVVLVDSDPGRLHARQQVVRQAGFLTLPAPTVQRAWDLVRKVRVALVLTEAQLDDGHSADLLRILRDEAAAAHLPLAVLGPLTPDERGALTHDAAVYVSAHGDNAALLDLLHAAFSDPNRS